MYTFGDIHKWRDISFVFVSCWQSGSSSIFLSFTIVFCTIVWPERNPLKHLPEKILFTLCFSELSSTYFRKYSFEKLAFHDMLDRSVPIIHACCHFWMAPISSWSKHHQLVPTTGDQITNMVKRYIYICLYAFLHEWTNNVKSILFCSVLVASLEVALVQIDTISIPVLLSPEWSLFSLLGTLVEFQAVLLWK